MKRYGLNWLITLLILFPTGSDLLAINGNLGGPTQDGSADHPYLIQDFADFNEFASDANYWDDNIRLETDVNLAGIPYSTAPIAGDTNGDTIFDGILFKGSFDGNEHVISNLTINGSNYCGLFGSTNQNAFIGNLGLENISINATGNFVGSFVGYNENGIVKNCYATGTIIGNDYVGGIVGEIYSANTTNCYFTGTVTGHYYVGGIVGDNLYGNIMNCYSTESISGTGYIGGVVGYHTHGNIANCYATMEVNGVFDIGGIIGYNYYDIGSVSNCFWDVNTSGINISDGGIGKTTIEMQDVNTFLSANWDFLADNNDGTSQIWQMSASTGYPVLSIFNGYNPMVLSGEGSPTDPYLIHNATELGAIYYYRNHAYFRLENNIDLSGIKWSESPIPWFSDFFDGNGYAILNLNIEGGCWLGLFGKTKASAEIRNLGLENISITSDYYEVGGLVGRNNGNIMSCYSTGIIDGNSFQVGGIVGNNENNVTNCYSTVVINNDTGDVSGGVIGFNSGSAKNCYSTGLINASGNYVGGFVGYNSGSIESCFWDTDTSGITTSNNGIGKTTAEMKTTTTFTDADWDFIDTWNIGENQTYPFLRKYTAADLNHDSTVNFKDFAILANNWLTSIE